MYFNPNYISLVEWLQQRKHIYMYLVVGPGDKLKQGWAELANMPADEQFQKAVNRMVTAYIEKGEMPPDEIAPTILNLADDAMAGRDIVIRAGDYIALRNYMRAKRT